MKASESFGPLAPFIDGLYDVRAEFADYVYRRTECHLDAADRAIRELRTPEQVRDRQQRTRQWTREAIGGVIAHDGPLEAVSCGTLERPGHTIEKVVFQSLPRMYVTANLYRPAGTPGPHPAVLFLCGHSELGKAEPTYQRVCAWLAQSGFVVLVLDPIGQGERKSYLDANGDEVIPWGIEEHSYAGLQCWWRGTSIAKYFIHDARRGLDYLTSLEDVDSARIGITGNSGGGTQSVQVMMLDDRLAAAAPGTFITSQRAYLRSGQAQDAEQILMGGTARGITHADFLIEMAPRPVHVLAVDYDFFSVEGTVESIDLARPAFATLGHEDALSLFRTRGLHGYTAELARSAVDFFLRELGGSATAPELPPFEAVPAEDLTCTDAGQVQREFADSHMVFELLMAQDSAAPAQPSGAGPDELRSWLLERVVAGRTPARELFPRWLESRKPRASLSARRVLWRSEKDLFSHGVLYEPTEGRSQSVTIALFHEGTDAIDENKKWIVGRVAAGESVLVVDLRAMGALAPRPINDYPVHAHYGTDFKLSCDLMEIDDSLAAGRVHDLLRALEFVRSDPEVQLGERSLRVYAEDAGQFYAVLAAVLDKGEVEVELATELLDPTQLVTSRYYDFEYSLATLIPGLLGAGSFQDLIAPATDRISVVGNARSCADARR